MTGSPVDAASGYALALASAFVASAGKEAKSTEVDIDALAIFFQRQFTREALRIPHDGREEFLSAVALELLSRINEGNLSGSLPELEAAFKRATLTVLDTVRHRIMRAQTRGRFREHALEQLDVESYPASQGPDLERLLHRELSDRLSADTATVLYYVTQGYDTDDIAKQMNVSKRTIYRALQAIRRILEESRREDPT